MPHLAEDSDETQGRRAAGAMADPFVEWADGDGRPTVARARCRTWRGPLGALSRGGWFHVLIDREALSGQDAPDPMSVTVAVPRSEFRHGEDRYSVPRPWRMPWSATAAGCRCCTPRPSANCASGRRSSRPPSAPGRWKGEANMGDTDGACIT